MHIASEYLLNFANITSKCIGCKGIEKSFYLEIDDRKFLQLVSEVVITESQMIFTL